MTISSALNVAGALGGAFAGGAVGTVRGLAIATWLGTLVYWWHLRAALRESGDRPSDGWFGWSRQGGRHRGQARPASHPHPGPSPTPGWITVRLPLPPDRIRAEDDLP